MRRINVQLLCRIFHSLLHCLGIHPGLLRILHFRKIFQRIHDLLGSISGRDQLCDLLQCGPHHFTLCRQFLLRLADLFLAAVHLRKAFFSRGNPAFDAALCFICLCFDRFFQIFVKLCDLIGVQRDVDSAFN